MDSSPTCVGCVVLLCLIVFCLTLLASFFLLHLLNMYIYTYNNYTLKKLSYMYLGSSVTTVPVQNAGNYNAYSYCCTECFLCPRIARSSSCEHSGTPQSDHDADRLHPPSPAHHQECPAAAGGPPAADRGHQPQSVRAQDGEGVL